MSGPSAIWSALAGCAAALVLACGGPRAGPDAGDAGAPRPAATADAERAAGATAAEERVAEDPALEAVQGLAAEAARAVHEATRRAVAPRDAVPGHAPPPEPQRERAPAARQDAPEDAPDD